MTTVWAVGFVLTLISVWVLKNMREDGEPILVMWVALLLCTCSLFPILSLIVGSVVLLLSGLVLLIEDNVTWGLGKKSPGKLLKFLFKKIS